MKGKQTTPLNSLCFNICFIIASYMHQLVTIVWFIVRVQPMFNPLETLHASKGPNYKVSDDAVQIAIFWTPENIQFKGGRKTAQLCTISYTMCVIDERSIQWMSKIKEAFLTTLFETLLQYKCFVVSYLQFARIAGYIVRPP